MSKQLKNVSKIKWPKPRTDEAEFGKAPKGTLRCTRCASVFYKKSWHHPAAFAAKFGKPAQEPKATICPACAMIAHKQFEGEVVIEAPPERFRAELARLIRAYGKRAFERDPMDRVIAVKERGNDVVATTTENQLAAKLAKKIKTAFPPVRVRVEHVREPSDVGRSRLRLIHGTKPKERHVRGEPHGSPLRKRGEFHYTVRRRQP